MHPEAGHDTGPRQRRAAWVLGALVVLAFALRFWRLGDWSFDSDEIFMRRDSLHPKLTNPRPLLYFINHYFVASWRPLNELGIRLLPALFGVLAVPAFYWVARRLLGTRTALLATLLVTVSPGLIIYSQFGRYWSLVFLLSAVYPYALYLGVRERDRRAMAVGVVAGVLAALAHPSAVLLVGGPALWFLVTFLRGRNLRQLWTQRRVRWGTYIAAALLVVIVMRFIPILQGWISEHDANPGSGQFLLRPSAPPGVKQLYYLLAFARDLAPSVMLIAVAGIYLLWQRDRFLAMFLLSLALFPLLFLMSIMSRTPVSTYYLLPTAPAYFLAAGVFLERVAQVDWRLRARWLVPATVVILVLIPDAPTVVSQYLNGRRYDFKAVGHWLKPRLSSSDVIYSDQPVALAYYLPRARVERLRFNTAPLEASLRQFRDSDPSAALWIVVPAPAHAFRPSLKQGGLAAWMYGNCQLRNSLGAGRLDFRQQYLEVFRCPPASSARSADGQLRPPVADSMSSG
jgi:4-amino-4-deoxy-L-arabinose transferase-like glycosyltransferase